MKRYERVPRMYVTIRQHGDIHLIDTAQISEMGWDDAKALEKGWEPVYVLRDNEAMED